MQFQQAINHPLSTTLYCLVKDLIDKSAPLAFYNRNYIINDIPADLYIETNSLIISDVLNKLFETVIRHAQNSVIFISAKVYGLVVLVHVKSKGSISPELQDGIDTACSTALETGGIIEIIQCESEQASIAYSFLNVAGVAL
jgi:hypothetical protein